MDTVNPKILEMFREFNAPIHRAMDEMKEIVRATRDSRNESQREVRMKDENRAAIQDK